MCRFSVWAGAWEEITVVFVVRLMRVLELCHQLCKKEKKKVHNIKAH